MAAKLLDNAEKANKTVTAGNIAYYTILHMKSGRRSSGASTVDALGIGAQLMGKSRTTSFDEPVHEVSELGEEFTVNDVFSNDSDDPGQIAARKIDWEIFLARLTVREKSVVEGLLAGLNASEIARSVKVDPSTIRYFKERLAAKILDFMGLDILIEIRRTPKWRDKQGATDIKLTNPTIAVVSPNTVGLFWPDNGHSYLLQTNGDLTTTNWGNYGSAVNLANGTNQVIISAPTGNTFYRLINPTP